MNDMSRNLMLILLAIRLQRLVKNLPNNHVSAERISKKSLAEEYLSYEFSTSKDGARKKAGRYMDEIESIFGLRGTEETGYVMQEKFKKFRDMFQFWLEKITPPGKDDKRLHVTLEGLLHAIDNAFSLDPIVVPKLAQQLKQKYGNKNIRDTSKPLHELFENTYIGSYLQLIEEDDDALCIDTSMDPLLLRLKPRSEIDGNEDISVNIARPGRIRAVIDNIMHDQDKETYAKVQSIAEAVCHSSIWHMNGEEYLPYILYREGKDGNIMLTMRNLSRSHFEDVAVDQLSVIPDSATFYCPFEIDPSVWASFRQLAT